ncbi:MAG: phosphoribosylaminoimidazolesuccinocarboxamide synthase [Clostridia bacterium]|nr:phosphoribosylaminoimidazolesuccinocarboxamide synthase [Clostridia bacterium]
MERKEMLYEGKTKQVFATDNPNERIVRFKDDATAFNGLKKGMISGKGVINNKISSMLMQVLEKSGVPTHFIGEYSDRESIVKRVDIIPIEVVMRNVAAGSLSKRLGLPEGTRLKRTIMELCYKKESLGDPMINVSHILSLGLATEEDVKIIMDYAYKINDVLSAYLKTVKINLIDYKLEFGKTEDGSIILADEISPDTCRFWDILTNEKLDMDRFRKGLGNVEEAYNIVYSRLKEKSV